MTKHGIRFTATKRLDVHASGDATNQRGRADDPTDAAEAAGGCENPIRFKRKNKMVFFPRAMKKKKKKKLQIDESET